MNSKIKEHYKKLFTDHGDSPKSVQWADELTQLNRFEILSQISDDVNSYIDLGCGLAHFYEFVKKKGYTGHYLGLDFMEDFIERNESFYEKDGKSSFQVFDVLKDDMPEDYDFTIISGMFNNEIEDNESWMKETLMKVFKASKKGVAFNALSSYVDYFDKGLYYSDPVNVFDFCKKNLTKKVTLRHDYLLKPNSIPYEYSIYLYK